MKRPMKPNPQFSNAIEQAVLAWQQLHGRAAVREQTMGVPPQDGATERLAAERLAALLLVREAGRALRRVGVSESGVISEPLLRVALTIMISEVDPSGKVEAVTDVCPHCEVQRALDKWAEQHGRKVCEIATQGGRLNPHDDGTEEFHIAILRALGAAMALGSELGSVAGHAPSSDAAREALAGVIGELGDGIPSSVTALGRIESFDNNPGFAVFREALRTASEASGR